MSQFQIRYQNDDRQVWNVLDNCTEIHDTRGLVPTCPVPALQGYLLTSASTATSANNEPRLHSKLDHTRWAYSGRSYGMGSAAGVSKVSLPGTEAIVAYSYREFGYCTEVRCQKNASSDITITPLAEDQYGHTFFVLSGAIGNEPPGTGEFYPLGSMNGVDPLLSWAARSYENNNMVTIAAFGKTWQAWNKTQCSMTFQPAAFNVGVNVTSKLITVEKDTTAMRIEDVEPTGMLVFSTVQSLNLLARMSNTFYISALGSALQSNLYNLQNQLGENAAGNETMLLRATEDSFAAMIDDILVAYGASQLLNAQDSTDVVITARTQAIQIGKHIWIYLVVALNCILLLLLVEECIRTRFWSELSDFDYTNIKCVVTAASAGGPGIADQVIDQNNHAGHSFWHGSPEDTVFDRVEVIFNYGAAARGDYAPAAYLAEDKRGTLPTLTAVNTSVVTVRAQPARSQASPPPTKSYWSPASFKPMYSAVPVTQDHDQFLIKRKAVTSNAGSTSP
jgi:hypothetical protein